MAFEGGLPTVGNGDHRIAFHQDLGSQRLTKTGALDEYSRWPRLRFRVMWNSLAPTSFFSLPITRHLRAKNTRGSMKRRLSESDSPIASKISKLQRHSDLGEETEVAPGVVGEDQSETLEERGQDNTNTSTSVDVVYLFFYGGDEKRILQWTKTRDMICPWCKLNCRRSGK